MRHPIQAIKDGWLYLYSCYLTLRFVDSYTCFPAICVRKDWVRLVIHKREGAKFILHDKLIVEPWFGHTDRSTISLEENSILDVKGELVIGDDVHLVVSRDARLEFGGRLKESSSGITARSLIMVNKSLVFGTDALIAWDTYITDCDWHQIQGQSSQKDTIIGDHVWIASYARILKGTQVGDNCIIGCNSVLSNHQYPARSLIVGNPAKVVKSSCPEWTR